MTKQTARRERLLNPDGRRHHRKTYSMTEFRLGMVILACLLLITAWVAWKGAHPDPELFAAGPDLLVGAKATDARGPLPDALAADGWSEGPVSQFDRSNVYEKIDGREDYYKSFGFERLTFITLTREDDETATVDIELFDLGAANNALGAYAGERPSDVVPTVGDGGLSHLSRNAAFLSRGRFYARIIGSSDAPPVVEQARYIRDRLIEALPAETLPWGYGLFLGAMGVQPGKIRYLAENAFSFGFARRIYSASDGAGETELFVTAQDNDVAATALADKLRQGFGSLGDDVGGGWIKHRFLGEIAGAQTHGAWVIGVRQAPDVETAIASLARLRQAVQSAPVALLKRAQAGARPADEKIAAPDEDSAYDIVGVEE